MKKPNRSWVEIDTEALGNNVELIRSRIHTSRIMAIVKANAYGTGMDSALYMQAMGIDFFGVACMEEALELRRRGITEEILILGESSYQQMKYLTRYDLIQTVTSLEYAQELNRMNANKLLKIRCHLKVDTGMHRNGVENLADIIYIYELPNLIMEGIYTHLSAADEKTDLARKQTEKQLNRFLKVLQDLTEQGIAYGKTHALNSAGILHYGQYVFDYVRPGLLLYGFGEGKQWQEVLAVKSRIASLKEVEAGEYIGYGLTEQAIQPLTIAKIPIGYGDGIDRRLTHSTVMIRNQECMIIGRICMDQLLIDVTGLDCRIGDEVEVIPRKGGIQKTAKLLNTIENEVLVGFTARLERIYL